MKKFLLLIFLTVYTQSFSQASLDVVLKDSTTLKLTSLQVDVQIIGNYATTTYDMKFYNELNRTLEGELVFPLGEGQSVSRFAMDVNGKLREAVVVEKELARVAFESTVRQTIDPGLLEKTEGNNYKARVYPILPKSYKHIVLSFEQELASHNGLKIYELPLGLQNTLDHFSIRMKVFNGAALPRIKSSGYKNFFFTQDNQAFIAKLERQAHVPASSVIIELPNTNDTEKTLNYSDYFYVNHQLKPNTRLKQKPKKIKLLWDTSYSLRNRNLEKELAILNGYFEYVKEVEVQYIAFSNAIHQNTTFKIEDGNWEALKKALMQVEYDGGTAMNLFRAESNKSDETLLFSDGLVNLGAFSAKGKQAIYTINSTTSANHELLNKIATLSGGIYVNLVRLSQTEAINKLKQETFQFLGAKHGKDVYEVYPKNSTNISEDFSISGRFSEETTIELLFGYQGKVTQRIRVPIKSAQETALVKRLWAKQKLRYLNHDKDENRERIIALGKSCHLITDFTSMLILDRIEDYVRYRIEPPQELKEEYKERIKNLEEENVDRLEDLNNRRADVFDDYKAIQDWYATKFPKKKSKNPKKRQTANISAQDTTVTTANNANTNGDSAVRQPLVSTPTSERVNIAIDPVGGIVSGTILDADGLPLPGVSIVVKGTTRGTQTDFDGCFTINAKKDEELVVSYLGFSTQQVVIGDTGSTSINLEEDSSKLEEVVVVGYGTQVRREYTTAVSSVVSESLAGKASGVDISSNIARAGADSTVQIRGENSILNEHNPLYILNGAIATGNPLQELKPEDIEEIQVLKALSATAIYGARAANGVIIITTKDGLDENLEAIEKLNQEIAEKIELKSWNPDTPYLKLLEEEATPELAYKKYLEIRDEYASSPSFYLDVSDFFGKKGKSNVAITVLTNLMEVELNNHEIMKALAYKLEYFEQFDLAVVVYEKVLELRPEEAHSYRDLALAYEQSGAIQKAYDLLDRLYKGDLLEKDEEERFYGIEQLAFIELTRLVQKHGKSLKMSKAEKANFKEMPVDVRIVIDWNHNDTDIDLWVEDPNGEKASYKNVETDMGGRMSEDMTEGYGPEEFMLKNAVKGTYKVSVDYYADNVQKISGPTVLKVTMFTNYGKPNETRKTTTVRLDKEADELEIGSLAF